MQHQKMVDELAAVRAELARLRLRERQLKAAILRAPQAELVGRWHRAAVTRCEGSVFDPALLPPEVRLDPRYQRVAVIDTVHCLSLPPAPVQPRPGWPIRREPAAAVH